MCRRVFRSAIGVPNQVELEVGGIQPAIDKDVGMGDEGAELCVLFTFWICPYQIFA